MRRELLEKSRESALSAIQVFNNPLIQFKSETFIVLMVISWTYLLHAYYRSSNVEYRYFDQGPRRRSFHRTKRGAFKYWGLEDCLNYGKCPIDRETTNNLRFLIGLRHEIEHQMTKQLDDYLSSHYQACAVNYNDYVKKLFGTKYGIDTYLSYSLQLAELSIRQISDMKSPQVSRAVKAFITDFEENLTDEEYKSPRYAYRLNFSQRVANRPGAADAVVEFISPESPDARTVPPERWVHKDRERPKFRVKHVVHEVATAGYPRFTTYQHTQLWKAENARIEGNGFGILVEGEWFWYETWVDHVIKHCQDAGDRYR